ncbi:MAG: hypothetical protein J2P25_09380 [Nocardiopsaceae bacterium]|nr:hypothetical protein [Nocardiopsaceae bacterium]
MADAPSATRGTGAGVAEMRRLAERCGDLKRELVAFAESPRFARWREAELAKAAGGSSGGDGAEDFDEDDGDGGGRPPKGSDRWIAAMDDFIMTFRFPDGTGVVDRFLSARRKELRKPDRKILEGWRDPVDGIFEIRAKSDESITLYNLIDELTYQVYATISFTRLPAGEGDFLLARLVPMAPGAWTPSGSMSPFPREHVKVVAELALEWSGTRPQLAFRNPEKARLGWEMMRKDREEFVEFFGADQVIIPVAEAESRINAYYRQRQEKALARRAGDKPPAEATAGVDRPFFAMPPEVVQTNSTVGVIYDEVDGMSLLPDFGLLEELFTRPELAADPAYASVLLGYLDSESVYPGALRRMAEAHPDTADEVYRTVLKKPSFTWSKQGEQLLRKRKPWYFRQARYPKTTPVSDYLEQLLSS